MVTFNWSERGRGFERGAKPPSLLYSPLQPKRAKVYQYKTGWRWVMGEVKLSTKCK